MSCKIPYQAEDSIGVSNARFGWLATTFGVFMLCAHSVVADWEFSLKHVRWGEED